MAKRGADLCVVPTSDFHDSEYVSAHFAARRYLSGFSGSAGTLVVTNDGAFLWTDGRYFIQAEKELSGSGIALMRMGEPNVPTVYEFLERSLPEGGTIAFDGRVVTEDDRVKFAAAAAKKNGSLMTLYDLPGEVWQKRPPLPCGKAFSLPVRFCGRSRKDKLASLARRWKS
jgi:Xaa-Pro aminopeptidase